MNDKPNYYAIIPGDVRYDTELKDKAKLLYGEITALSNKEGCCYASNSYFAELYGVSITTISLLIKNLIEKGYLESEITYKEGSKEIDKRYLKIIKGGYLKNLKGGYLRKVKDNNTSINNTSMNKEIYKERFKKPTLEEVKEYCLGRKNNIDPKRFIDFYEANNWTDSKGNKVKSWKQKVITWESHQPKEKEVPEWFNKQYELDDTSSEEIENILKELEQ